MNQLTDQQILDLFNLKTMSEVSAIDISQQSSGYCAVGIHGTVDADMMPVVQAVERIVGIEVRLPEIREAKDRERETVQFLKYDSRYNDGCWLSVTIFSVQTFDEVA